LIYIGYICFDVLLITSSRVISLICLQRIQSPCLANTQIWSLVKSSVGECSQLHTMNRILACQLAEFEGVLRGLHKAVLVR